MKHAHRYKNYEVSSAVLLQPIVHRITGWISLAASVITETTEKARCKVVKPLQLCEFLNKNKIRFQKSPSIIFEINLEITQISIFGSISRKNAKVRK